jgi:hypothetical protein
MDREIVDKLISFGIEKKEDYKQLTALIGLIEANRKTPRVVVGDLSLSIPIGRQATLENLPNRSRIPLTILNGSGFKYSDIKRLHDISDLLTGTSFIIENADKFEKVARLPFYFEEDHPEATKERQENILLSLHLFNSTLLKEKLAEAEQYLVLPKKKVAKPIVFINLKGSIFLKDNRSNKIIISDKKFGIVTILSDRKPRTIFDLKDMVGYTEERRISTAIKEINDDFRDKLGQEQKLIDISGKGYHLNTHIFDIRVLKR